MANHPNRGRTFDFTGWSNYGNDPLRAEQLRIASTIDLPSIEVLHGPPGGHGFRRGMWSVRFDGQDYRFFTSVPHAAELDEQDRQVRRAAALHIAGLRSGYVAA